MNSNQILINPRSIPYYLGVIASLLVIASLITNLIMYFTGHDNVYGLIQLFYLDEEKNIPTAYSVFLLQFAAMLLFVISILKLKQSDSFSLLWAVLCMGFLFMASDEAWSFHEKIDAPGGILWGQHFHGLLYFAWIIPYIFLLVFLLLLFWKFLSSLSVKHRRLFLLAGIIYVGGAIGAESVGGYIVESIGRHNWWYYLEVTVEESLEMAGTIVFIYALLNYLHDNYVEVHFIITENKEDNLTNQ